MQRQHVVREQVDTDVVDDAVNLVAPNAVVVAVVVEMASSWVH